jgi:hypothetical protein
VIRRLGLLAIAAGTVLTVAGIVSLQAGSGGRSTALLVALALLYVGGMYGRAVLTAVTSQPVPVPPGPSGPTMPPRPRVEVKP